MQHAVEYRSLIRTQTAAPVTDGDGVKIKRTVARGNLGAFDPFLLLDEIRSDEAADYIGGFPEHPHRGFETVTYMLEGRMRHRDHMGNEGLLVSGGVQWMTAGRGVLHSEMPEQESGRLHGFQLWINLPAAQKMVDPRYQEFAPEQIPQVALSDSSWIRVIAGAYQANDDTVTGPIQAAATQAEYYDIQLAKGDSLELPIDASKRVIVYPFQGSVLVDNGRQSSELQTQQLGELGNGNQIKLIASEDARLLVLAGKPLDEPIANWGPFVMNTREEIDQAIQDYRNGTLVD